MIYLGFGFELVSLIAASAYLGSLIEKSYPSRGLITVVIIIGAFVAWITRITLWARSQEKKDQNKTEQ